MKINAVFRAIIDFFFGFFGLKKDFLLILSVLLLKYFTFKDLRFTKSDLA